MFVLGGFALPIFFYDVDKEYIGYLKQFEQKIPNISYDKHDKFVCGIVLTVNGFNYFAPVSSFNKSQKTNFLINDKIGNDVASIRFSFMFPVPNELLKIKEFHKEEEKYRNLLQYEYKYCNKHIDEIYKKAQYVYKRVKIKDSFYSKICCNFELLEINRMPEYIMCFLCYKIMCSCNHELSFQFCLASKLSIKILKCLILLLQLH